MHYFLLCKNAWWQQANWQETIVQPVSVQRALAKKQKTKNKIHDHPEKKVFYDRQSILLHVPCEFVEIPIGVGNGYKEALYKRVGAAQLVNSGRVNVSLIAMLCCKLIVYIFFKTLLFNSVMRDWITELLFLIFLWILFTVTQCLYETNQTFTVRIRYFQELLLQQRQSDNYSLNWNYKNTIFHYKIQTVHYNFKVYKCRIRVGLREWVKLKTYSSAYHSAG